MSNSKNKDRQFGLHRIASVRRRERVSLRCAAKRMGIPLREAERQEGSDSDLRLSQLYAWQQVLDVPISELLVEPEESLADGVQTRAQLVRVMKTALLLLQKSKDSAIERLAQNLFNDLIEIMPELADVKSLPTHGNLRTKRDVPRIIAQQVSSQWFGYEHEPTD